MSDISGKTTTDATINVVVTGNASEGVDATQTVAKAVQDLVSTFTDAGGDIVRQSKTMAEGVEGDVARITAAFAALAKTDIGEDISEQMSSMSDDVQKAMEDMAEALSSDDLSDDVFQPILNSVDQLGESLGDLAGYITEAFDPATAAITKFNTELTDTEEIAKSVAGIITGLVTEVQDLVKAMTSASEEAVAMSKSVSEVGLASTTAAEEETSAANASVSSGRRMSTSVPTRSRSSQFKTTPDDEGVQWNGGLFYSGMIAQQMGLGPLGSMLNMLANANQMSVMIDEFGHKNRGLTTAASEAGDSDLYDGNLSAMGEDVSATSGVDTTEAAAETTKASTGLTTAASDQIRAATALEGAATSLKASAAENEASGGVGQLGHLGQELPEDSDGTMTDIGDAAVGEDAEMAAAGVEGAGAEGGGMLASAGGMLGISGLGAATMGGGLATGATIMGIKASIDQYTQLTQTISQMQLVTGGSAQQTSLLVGQFQDLGMDTDDLTSLMQRFGTNVENNNSKLQALGIQVKYNASGTVNYAATLEEVREKYQATSDAAQKDAIAQAAFGGRTAQLNEYLEASNQQIDKFNQQTLSTHQVLSDQQIAQAKAYSEGVNELEQKFHGLETEIGEDVVPSLLKLLDGGEQFAHDLVQWGKDVDNFVDDNLHPLATAIKDIYNNFKWSVGIGEGEWIFDKLESMGSGQAASQEAAAQATEKNTTAVGSQAATAQETTIALNTMKSAIQAVTTAQQAEASEQAKLNSTMQTYYTDYTEAQANASDAASSLADAQSQLTDSQQKVGDDQLAISDDTQNLAVARINLTEVTKEAVNTELSLKNALAEASTDEAQDQLNVLKGQQEVLTATNGIDLAQGLIDEQQAHEQATSDIVAHHNALIALNAYKQYGDMSQSAYTDALQTERDDYQKLIDDKESLVDLYTTIGQNQTAVKTDTEALQVATTDLAKAQGQWLGALKADPDWEAVGTEYASMQQAYENIKNIEDTVQSDQTKTSTAVVTAIDTVEAQIAKDPAAAAMLLAQYPNASGLIEQILQQAGVSKSSADYKKTQEKDKASAQQALHSALDEALNGSWFTAGIGTGQVGGASTTIGTQNVTINVKGDGKHPNVLAQELRKELNKATKRSGTQLGKGR